MGHIGLLTNTSKMREVFIVLVFLKFDDSALLRVFSVSPSVMSLTGFSALSS